MTKKTFRRLDFATRVGVIVSVAVAFVAGIWGNALAMKIALTVTVVSFAGGIAMSCLLKNYIESDTE